MKNTNADHKKGNLNNNHYEVNKLVKYYARGLSKIPDSVIAPITFTDSFGFFNEHAVSRYDTNLKKKHTKQDSRRNIRWLKMLNQWKDYKGTSKLTDRVYKGIPDTLRGYAWSLMLDVPHLMAKNRGLYEDMKMRITWEGEEITITQIHMDVLRTFRAHHLFWKDCSIKQCQLFFLLSTYSIYNTGLQYCQGMSDMAAIFLMYMNEEEAFWALTAFISGDKISMHGFMVNSFPKLTRFQNHLDVVLKTLLPRVYKKMNEFEVSQMEYNIEWFMVAYTRFPFSLCMRIWDVMMLKGEEVLIGMALTILKLLQREILETTDRIELSEIFHDFSNNKLFESENEENILFFLQSNLLDLKRNHLLVPPPPVNSAEDFTLQCRGREAIKSKGRRASLGVGDVPRDGGGDEFIKTAPNRVAKRSH